MSFIQTYQRQAAIVLLWTLVALSGFLILVHTSTIVLGKDGHWQWPDYYKVEVVEVIKDPGNNRSADVQVTIDGSLETITLPKVEATSLHPRDTLWVLDNFYPTDVRSPQYRLSLARILAEYPFLMVLVAFLLLKLIQRSRWGIPPPPPEVPDSEKKVFRDTFHTRAQRHAPSPTSPDDNPSTSTTDTLQ